MTPITAMRYLGLSLAHYTFAVAHIEITAHESHRSIHVQETVYSKVKIFGYRITGIMKN